MRFVLCAGIFTLLSTPSLAAPWDVVPLASETSAASQSPRPVNMQRGGTSNTLQTLEGLTLNIVATGLGDVSAMALGENGTLYTVDKTSGRIWALTDRGQDGKIDLRRPLPFNFDSPTGLTVDGKTIYVVDKKAVWVIEDGQGLRELATLSNAQSTGTMHALLTDAKSPSVTLGITSRDNGVRILDIDKQTGEAMLKADGIDGTLSSLAQRSGSEIWAASGTQLGPLGGKPVRFTKMQSIAALALPGQYQTPRNWPAQLNDHIIASHQGPRAMQIIAIPTEFGQISGAPRVLVDGFLTLSGYSAWGRPGAMLMDERGLFFADGHNGTVWRLSPKPRPQPKITIVDTADLPPRPEGEPKLAAGPKAIGIESSIKGTQIDAKSSIVQPSSIIYGSKLIKDYDEKKAAEDAAKDEDTPKKKRRMSRKRKQKQE